MLSVQAYLRTEGQDLQTLKEGYAINYRINEELGVVCLNYNQIESDMRQPIVIECRQLILEMGTWNVISISFEKFHNFAEDRTPDFDWSDFKTYEKLDGSILTFWHHKTHGWQIATRSVPDGSTSTGDSDMSFKDLVLLTLKDMGLTFEGVTSYMEPGYSYVCELCCPENQVVVQHQTRSLTLLAVRSIREPYFKECDLETWSSWNPQFPLPLVTRYDGFSQEAILSNVQERNPIEHEGYVLVDKNFNRVKIKSDAYCLMSHQRDGLGKSNRARLELIFSLQDDDIIGLLPKYVQDKIIDLKLRVANLAKKLDFDYQGIKHVDNQKEFALIVLDKQANFVSPAMFAMKKGVCSTGMDYIKQTSVASVLRLLELDD